MLQMQVAIAEAGAIPPLVDLLRNGTSTKCRDSAVGALHVLSVNLENKVCACVQTFLIATPDSCKPFLLLNLAIHHCAFVFMHLYDL